MSALNYPTLSEHALAEIVAKVIASGQAPDPDVVDAAVNWSGPVDEGLVGRLTKAANACNSEIEGRGEDAGGTEGDEAEGRVAPKLLDAVIDLPVPVLDDPGFWRYVAVRHLWNFTWWRERGAFDAVSAYDKRRAAGEPLEEGEKRPTSYMDYLSGRKPAECVPLRMYLRARIARRGADDTLSSSAPDATDFWRSHIVRVRTGSAPVLSQSFIKLQSSEKRMATDPLREFARRLNRTWANVVLDLYEDPADCDALLAELDHR